jgi:hypothetical protein
MVTNLGCSRSHLTKVNMRTWTGSLTMAEENWPTKKLLEDHLLLSTDVRLDVIKIGLRTQPPVSIYGNWLSPYVVQLRLHNKRSENSCKLRKWNVTCLVLLIRVSTVFDCRRYVTYLRLNKDCID